MAGIYAPIVTNYPNGVVSVISNTGTSYEQIINSMGSFAYEVGSMYIQSNTIQQVLQPLRFSQYDVNGTLQSYNQVTAVDPFQFQSSINFDLSKDGVVLEGRTTLDTQMLASEQLSVILYTNTIANKSLLSGTDIFNQDDFYQDYSESVNDNALTVNPTLAVEQINNAVNTKEDVKINIGDELKVSATPTPTSIKYNSISNSAATTPTTKKQNPSYWILVVISSAFAIGYLIKKISK